MRFLILCALVSIASAAFKVDKMANRGLQLLHASEIPGQSVRQCSCPEYSACKGQITQQVTQCIDGCMETLRAIAPNPYALRMCIDRKKGVMDGVRQCAENSLGLCVPSMAGPVHPKVNYQVFANQVEGEILANKGKLLSSGPLARVPQLGETAIRFGQCVKGCYFNANRAGDCFDRSRCQPWAADATIKRTIKTCMKQFDWKQHAGETCQCAVQAGVRGLDQFCSVLRLMSPRG